MIDGSTKKNEAPKISQYYTTEAPKSLSTILLTPFLFFVFVLQFSTSIVMKGRGDQITALLKKKIIKFLHKNF